MPIFFHTISDWVFVLSGVVSVGVITLFMLALRKFSHTIIPTRHIWFTRLSVALILVAINFLYFTNLIPPLPLSLKDSGVYQSFTVNGPGNYTAQSEGQGFFSFFHWSDTIHMRPGSPLYVYTAVFSPTSFNLPVIHEWQRYSETQSRWITQSRVTLPVTGGGDRGYRTFSLIESPIAGAWRVNVKTPTDQIIGQVRFNLIVTSTLPTLNTVQIN